MQELKACMRYIFILSVMIIVGVFATDWWFTRDGDLLNDTLVGVMIGAPIGWFGSFVGFYTTEKVSQMTKKEEVENGNAPPGKDH
ncbi:MAG: hypothetical protein OXH00_26020 [Candidatus Poribacteria bacterium]|nr:hypothetical protein [Candidatus Poribacteria bacterium]